MEEEEVVVVGTTMVEVSRVEEGEDRFGEAEVVMVGGEEEGGTKSAVDITSENPNIDGNSCEHLSSFARRK